VERLQLGVDHGEVGAYLLGLWGLSFPIIEAVAFHHEPERVPQMALDLVGTVHIADSLANEVRGGSGEDRESVNSAYLEELGVADNMDGWRETGRAIHEEDAR
jgi:HD-like signal output (HDOD) protein